MKLIAFTGKKYHGKDTAADALQAVRRYAFADQAKQATIAAFNLRREQLYDPGQKDVVDPRWGRTPRELNCELADFLRAKDPEHFIKILQEKMEGDQGLVVITDCRYDNEAEWIKGMGGIIIHIHNPRVPIPEGPEHSSEAGISARFIDHHILNDGTKEELHWKIRSLLAEPTEVGDFYDTIIVGAGPAGIAAGEVLLMYGREDFALLDKGSRQRDLHNPTDVANGFGGAALLSDGKLSFPPSGTKVWKLHDPTLVELGLRKLIKDMSLEDAKERLLATLAELAEEPPVVEGTWNHKPYESIYVPEEKRKEILDRSYDRLGAYFKPGCDVIKVGKRGEDGNYTVYYQKSGDHVTVHRVKCRKVIVGGGRFTPLFLELEGAEKVFRRVEIGVRLETTSNNFIWSAMKGVDPKYYRKEGLKEYRTFCCCRDGMIVQTECNGIECLSGRADCPPTGTSNIGFNLRVLDPAYKHYLEQMIRRNVWGEGGAKIFRTTLKEFQNTTDYFPYNPLESLLRQGLAAFQEKYPSLDPETTTVNGPCFEGVGEYWRLDNNLKVPGEDWWVVGDNTGIFRGWTAAYISGFYAANVSQLLTYKVNNRIIDEGKYRQTYPSMVGSGGGKALHEIHIFLEPLNPRPEQVKKFEQDVAEYNRLNRGPGKPMKACHLALNYRDSGEVCALQSSRYVSSNNLEEVVAACHADALYFTQCGFDVIRQKIEASAHAIDGIPLTEEDVRKHPTKYFEYHIRVESGVPEGPLTVEEIGKLVQASQELTRTLGIPVPLSYNKSKGDDGTHQKYLNLRFRGMGLQEVKGRVDFVSDALRETGLTVAKVIAEYVWYDTLTSMDKGWIDF